MTQNVDTLLGTSTSSDLPRSSSIVHRYRDTYRVASAVVGFGTILKVLGWLFGLLTTMGGFVVANHLNSSAKEQAIILLTLICAGAQIVIFYFLGVLVSAIGQILRATLDTAVHTSPLMDNQQRSEAMRI